jgi:hypothetical protein
MSKEYINLKNNGMKKSVNQNDHIFNINTQKNYGRFKIMSKEYINLKNNDMKKSVNQNDHIFNINTQKITAGRVRVIMFHATFNDISTLSHKGTTI